MKPYEWTVSDLQEFFLCPKAVAYWKKRLAEYRKPDLTNRGDVR